MGRPDTWATRETPVAVTEGEEHGQARKHGLTHPWNAEVVQAPLRRMRERGPQFYRRNLYLTRKPRFVLDGDGGASRQPMAVGALLETYVV